MTLSWASVQVLAEIHRRSTVHGDLKPANIHVSADKTLVTLLDFGAASVSEGVHYNMQHSWVPLGQNIKRVLVLHVGVTGMMM